MMHLSLCSALTLSAGLLVTPVALGGVDDEDLKVRRITLYRSGVGYFELAGEIRGDHSFQLKFDTDRINDILKSMTILDLGDGQIGPVSYGSKEPLERRRRSSFGLRHHIGQVVPSADVPNTFELPPGLAEIFPAGLPPRLVVLGAGGAGKTVLTKQLVVGTSLELLRGAAVVFCVLIINIV